MDSSSGGIAGVSFISGVLARGGKKRRAPAIADEGFQKTGQQIRSFERGSRTASGPSRLSITKVSELQQGVKIGLGAKIAKHISATATWDPANLASDEKEPANGAAGRNAMDNLRGQVALVTANIRDSYDTNGLSEPL